MSVAVVRERTAAQERATLLAVSTDCAQSSRQLLLGLGHLVTSHSLDQLVLWKISTLLSGMESPVTEEQKSAYECVGEQIVREQEDLRNHALWLAGRIHHAANNLAELSKVQGGNWLQLSETELMLRRQTDMVPEYLKKVTAAGELLEAYKNWKKHAHLFTSWMESVPGWKGAAR